MKLLRNQFLLYTGLFFLLGIMISCGNSVLPFDTLAEVESLYANSEGSVTAIKLQSPLQENETNFIALNDSRIIYQGRIGGLSDGLPTLGWPGVSFTVRVKGGAATNWVGFLLSAEGGDEIKEANYFEVIFNGNSISNFGLITKDTYSLKIYFPEGEHTITVFKRTEASANKIRLLSVACDNSSVFLTPPDVPQRKIEFLGDSITCGLANECPVPATQAMEDDRAYQNHYLAYGPLTARALQADFHSLSISGIALACGWDSQEGTSSSLPYHWKKTDRFDYSDTWNFASWVPDVVVVNLFQNDYWVTLWGAPTPPAVNYKDKYKAFLSDIRSKYPNANIICCLGAMDAVDNATWRGYVTSAVSEMGDPKLHTLFFPYVGYTGQGQHPRLSEHAEMAELLTQKIKEVMTW